MKSVSRALTPLVLARWLSADFMPARPWLKKPCRTDSRLPLQDAAGFFSKGPGGAGRPYGALPLLQDGQHGYAHEYSVVKSYGGSSYLEGDKLRPDENVIRHANGMCVPIHITNPGNS